MDIPAKAEVDVGGLAQSQRRDFSGVSYAQAVQRARDLVPLLRQRAEHTEQARRLTRDIEQVLHESGLLRIHQPKAFGGMELDFVGVVDIPAEIGRACPSTAWTVGNIACHHWMLGMFPPQAQREVWDANPDAMIASSIALAAGRARKADGGFIVSGRWPFSSAVESCDWNLLAVTVLAEDGKTAVDWRLCLVPRSGYEIIDTWFAMGMSGTGSKDIKVDELFVPEHRALALIEARGQPDHPGASLSAGPLFRVPLVAGAAHPLAPAALGAAEGAYEHFVATIKQRAGTYTGARIADFQAVQTKVARARCLIDSARQLLRQSAIDLHAIAERREMPDLETKLRFRAHAAFAVNQSREAVEALFSCYGANGLYTRDPIQRYLRDVIAINQHFSFNFDIFGAAFGLQTLGGTYKNPSL